MASTIILRSPGGVDDKRIRLSSSSFARTMSIGNSWNHIRIGARLGISIGDVGTYQPRLIGYPKFFMGVCSGLTNIYGDATTTNACGVVQNVENWIYGTSGSDQYFNVSNYAFPVKKVGTTETISGSSVVANPGPYYGANAAGNFRDVWFVEIVKGSPNYSFYAYWQNQLYDWTVSDFLAQMQLATPTYVNHFLTGPSAFAVDEVAGGFDSVCVAWNKISPAFELSDLAVCKFS